MIIMFTLHHITSLLAVNNTWPQNEIQKLHYKEEMLGKYKQFTEKREGNKQVRTCKNNSPHKNTPFILQKDNGRMRGQNVHLQLHSKFAFTNTENETGTLLGCCRAVARLP